MGRCRIGEHLYTCPQCGKEFRLDCAKVDYLYTFTRRGEHPKVIVLCGAQCYNDYAIARRAARALPAQPMSDSERVKRYRAEHRDKYREYQRQYRRTHKGENDGSE